jgi:hypothetical protein
VDLHGLLHSSSRIFFFNVRVACTVACGNGFRANVQVYDGVGGILYGVPSAWVELMAGQPLGLVYTGRVTVWFRGWASVA